ncbi:MAG: HAMP domain-containing protein [Deltaproteobacteria bacterium]|nr:MAG: HAMP domain-containing protein [Deltaproteobacteria bacterium]
MKRLYFKTSLGILLSIAASFVLLFLFLPKRGGHRVTELAERVLGKGGFLIRQELEKRSFSEGQDWLKKREGFLLTPFKLLPSLPKHTKALQTAPLRGVVSLVSHKKRKDGLYFYLPVSHGVLQVGPVVPPRPPGRDLLLHVLLLCLTVLIFSAILIAPIAKRIRSLEKGTKALSEGHWDVKVEEGRHDAFGLLARSFNTMTQQIQKLFEDREELLQAVSHELGTPLSRMRFSLALLQSARSLEAQQRHMDALDVDLNELEELSVELVNWLEADSPSLQAEDLSLHPILEQLVEQVSEDVPNEIHVTLQGQAHLVAHVEGRQFQRAIENLLRNAARHAESLVVLEAYEKDGHAYIEVRDDGDGIPVERREEIFAPFVSYAKDSEDLRGGTGLGLAIVQRILRRHRGVVSCGVSQEGGALFQTQWPIK